MKRRRGGFVLVEVIASVTVSVALLVVVATLLAAVNGVRMRTAAARAAATTAHTRCELFARGLINPGIFDNEDAQPVVTTWAGPPDLPGGFPLAQQVETVTFDLNSDGTKRAATLTVEIFVEGTTLAASDKGVHIVATGVRYR